MWIFICFIGIDGCGKTTHALALCRELSGKGNKCVHIRSRYALLRFAPLVLRRWIDKHLSPRKITISYRTQKTHKARSMDIFKIPLTLFLLTYAFFTYFLCIRPHLRGSTVVVCDSDGYFFDWFYNLWGSTAVALTRILPKPDLAFLLDVPVAVAFSRMLYAGDKSISREYYESLQDWYLALTRQEGFHVIDSSGSFEKTKGLILDYVTFYLRK